MNMINASLKSGILASFIAVSTAAPLSLAASPDDKTFTIAVIPDTQYYLDYTHQKAEGFPFDANKLFIEQMQYIADNLESQGGDIAFVTSLGMSGNTRPCPWTKITRRGDSRLRLTPLWIEN